MIDILTHGLLSEEKNPGLLEAFVKNRERLSKAANLPKLNDSEYYRVLDLIIKFYDKYRKLPPNRTAIKEFAAQNKDLGVTEAWQTTLVEALKELKQIDEVRLKQCKTPEILIDQVVSGAKIEHIKHTAQSMVDIANQGPSQLDEKGKKKNPSGPDDAKLFAFKELARSVEANSEIASGLFHENVDKVALSLDARLNDDGHEGRMKIGYPHVDNSIVIGRQALRFIGIAGMSGDGKTTILNTIVYNLLRQGFNGLYLSFEHTPTEIWEFMTFLHTSHADYGGYKPPSLIEWELSNDPESGFTVTDEDKGHMGAVLQDVQKHRNLPGILDVQDASTISTFDGFVSHLEIYKESLNYDFAVIDYLARMDVGGDARFREKEIANMIHRAQFLTRSFNNGRGLVLLTPMQVNREANKNAKRAAAEDGADAEKGTTFYDLNAIANFSEYQHDMDYIFGVYSDENMKASYEMAMETLKIRKGKRPSTKYMEIDKSSGLVMYARPTSSGGKATGKTETFLRDDGEEVPIEGKSIKPPLGDEIDPNLTRKS